MIHDFGWVSTTVQLIHPLEHNKTSVSALENIIHVLYLLKFPDPTHRVKACFARQKILSAILLHCTLP